MDKLNRNALYNVLQTLADRLRVKNSSHIQLVICGGSALIALNLVSRTTGDVDVVALANRNGVLLSPVPFPEELIEAIHETAVLHGLSDDWLNNRPSSGEGGLFQEGLPEGLLNRAHMRQFGTHLTAYFIDRFDQIHFKVYAAADSMGVHVNDLMELNPASGELEQAARWCMTLDPSEEFRITIQTMFKELGYGDVAEKL